MSLRATAIPHLLEAVDLAMGDDFSQPARLLRFEDEDDRGVTLGIKELEPGQHPLDALLGFVAPDAWSALGTVCHGWASRNLDTRPSRASDRVRVRSLHMVARDGLEIGGLRLEGGGLSLQELVVGTVPDALRRCLGLATPPPPGPPAGLYATWEELRWAVITGVDTVTDVTPTLATWMDAGMFARWVGDVRG